MEICQAGSVPLFMTNASFLLVVLALLLGAAAETVKIVRRSRYAWIGHSCSAISALLLVAPCLYLWTYIISAVWFPATARALDATLVRLICS